MLLFRCFFFSHFSLLRDDYATITRRLRDDYARRLRDESRNLRQLLLQFFTTSHSSLRHTFFFLNLNYSSSVFNSPTRTYRAPSPYEAVVPCTRHLFSNLTFRFPFFTVLFFFFFFFFTRLIDSQIDHRRLLVTSFFLSFRPPNSQSSSNCNKEITPSNLILLYSSFVLQFPPLNIRNRDLPRFIARVINPYVIHIILLQIVRDSFSFLILDRENHTCHAEYANLCTDKAIR